MEEEMIYGSKPSTPVKRRFQNTPTKTPKYRKVSSYVFMYACVTYLEGLQGFSLTCILAVFNPNTLFRTLKNKVQGSRVMHTPSNRKSSFYL